MGIRNFGVILYAQRHWGSTSDDWVDGKATGESDGNG
jgi:hypothetical protein